MAYKGRVVFNAIRQKTEASAVCLKGSRFAWATKPIYAHDTPIVAPRKRRGSMLLSANTVHR